MRSCPPKQLRLRRHEEKHMPRYSDVQVAELQKQLAFEKEMRKMAEKYADTAEDVLESNIDLAK